MSTEFKLDGLDGLLIALRFWGGHGAGQIVRFAFPQEVMCHLKDVRVFGSNCEETTLGALFDQCAEADFIDPNVSPREHLSWGTDNARRRRAAQQAKLQWCWVD